MALNKASLKAGIEALNNELYTNASGLSRAQAAARHAEGMADLIDAYITSADGRYQNGSLVAGSTAVTATAAPAVIKLQ